MIIIVVAMKKYSVVYYIRNLHSRQTTENKNGVGYQFTFSKTLVLHFNLKLMPLHRCSSPRTQAQ